MAAAARLRYSVANWSSYVVEYHPRCRPTLILLLLTMSVAAYCRTILTTRRQDGCQRAQDIHRYVYAMTVGRRVNYSLSCRPQYVTLQLETPAVVSEITFGKYSRPHACNVKKVRVEGGMEEAKMVLLFEG